MPRVIQDSDDDLDDDLEVEVHRTEARDAPTKQFDSDTSSTEALRRQIEAVHRAHLQSQLTLNSNETPKTPEESYQKRKAPTGFDLHNDPEENHLAKNIFVEHISETNVVFTGSSWDSQRDQALISHVTQPVDPIDATRWVLEGAACESYARHNPNTIFAEPSSTVPNATLTQQRVLEGLLAPALVGSDFDTVGTPFQPDASIPWSEYLKSPTDPSEHPKSSLQRSYVSQNTQACGIGQGLDGASEHSISQSISRKSMTLTGCTPTHIMPMGKTAAKQSTVSPTGQAVSDLIPPQEQPSIASNTQRWNSSCSSQPAHRKKRSPSPRSVSDDDLVDLGFLKEQYKPRPSRSRSLKVATQASIDCSVRPKKSTKVSKRRKSTPASTEYTNALSTPDRVQQICDMGFTPSTSAKALNQNNGDVTMSVDWLITNRVADDELVSHASQTSICDNSEVVASFNSNEVIGSLEAGRRVKDRAMPTDTESGSNLSKHDLAATRTTSISPVADLKSSDKVQVVIPTKLHNTTADASAPPQVTGAKVKRRKTATEVPDPIATDVAAAVTKVEKKRRRGRPRKMAKTTLSAATMHEEGEKNLREQVCDSPLPTMDGNIGSDVAQDSMKDTEFLKTTRSFQGIRSSQLEETNTTIHISRSTPEPQQLPDRPEVEPITPKDVKNPAFREQLSNNKARMLYRVGLSRRTKIAPLLRVIKK